MRFPIDALITEPTFYNPGYPPANPNIQTFPEVSNYVQYIASAIANRITQECRTNYAKTYLYNEMSCSNWNNNTYSIAVKFASDFLYFKMVTNQCPDVNNCIEECVASTVDFLASDVYIRIKEVNEACNTIPNFPQHMQEVNSAFNFIQRQILDMKNRMGSMHNQFGPNFNQQQMFNQRMPQGYGNMQQPMIVQRPIGGYNPPMVGSQYNNQTTNRMSGGLSAASMSRFDDSSMRSIVNTGMPSFKNEPQVCEQKPVNVEIKLTNRDWKPSHKQYYLSMIDNSGEMELFEDDGFSNVIQNITPLFEDMNMDREKHRVDYFNNSYSSDIKPKIRNIEKESIKLAAQTREENIDLVDKARENSDIKIYLSPNYTNGFFLNETIYDIRKNIFTDENDISIYRQFATIYNPIVTNYNANDIIKDLTEYDTFVKVASRMKGLASAINNISDNKTPDILKTLTIVNKFYTKIINDFLKINLSLIEDSIDDFCEDIADLEIFLGENYSGPYTSAYRRYEEKILDSLMEMDELPSSLNSILNEKETNHTFLPVNYSLTFIKLLDKELNINLKEQPLVIREEAKPFLNNLAKSLFAQKNEFNKGTLYDLLITEDNVIYQIREGYLMHKCYLIAKFS